jgi:hypothetical protein
MRDESVLICQRVDVGDPSVHSAVDACATCGNPVWRALSSPPADRIICLTCVGPELDRVRASGGPMPSLTEEQKRDIVQYYASHAEDDYD